SPSLEDIATAMGYSATAARRGLVKLERRGYITRQPGSHVVLSSRNEAEGTSSSQQQPHRRGHR
ncbi:MAG: DeoR family transcriptional regulator, partial [Rhodomicrobium sp.]